ncbi:hypothetical protein [Natranaerofaba carboxydovora]|nr:hypothetical protein [Natranaerofaba carboxydovora]
MMGSSMPGVTKNLKINLRLKGMAGQKSFMTQIINYLETLLHKQGEF